MRRQLMRRLAVAIALFAVTVGHFPSLRAQLPPATASAIDAEAAKILASSSTPSISVAVVKDGRLAYAKAYGKARLDPPMAASPEMRYPIGSVSKQFLGGAIMLLVQDGKLSLDDPVARFLPDLTRAHDITVRQLLSHTSGYQDYYPLDYVAPFMQKPVTPDEILDRWARVPLNFEPGTQWQYSNTNFAVAGRILEKASGMPLGDFLRTRIFERLGMKSVVDLDSQHLAATDPVGYTHFALGPVRPVTSEAAGWLYAAGELAMTASDLARWDEALMESRLWTPASMHELTTQIVLKNGAPTGYALGLGINNASGHLKLGHGGAVSGYVSNNQVWVDLRFAVAALTNLDGSPAARDIVDRIQSLELAETVDPKAGERLEVVKRVFADLQKGTIDRSLLTSDSDAYFTPQVLADAASSLEPLGTPEGFDTRGSGLRGGMAFSGYRVRFAKGKTLSLTTFWTTDGKLAEYLFQ